MKTWLLIVFSCLLCACGTQKKIPATVLTEEVNKEIEVRYEKIFLTDTVFLEIPSQSTSIITPDTTSTLENDFAISKASIDTLGMLHHSLKTKPQKKPVPVNKEVERRDSIVYIDKKVEVPIPVERELTWWERTSIKWFQYSLGVIALAMLYIFRKPLLTLIRRFI